MRKLQHTNCNWNQKLQLMSNKRRLLRRNLSLLLINREIFRSFLTAAYQIIHFYKEFFVFCKDCKIGKFSDIVCSLSIFDSFNSIMKIAVIKFVAFVFGNPALITHWWPSKFYSISVDRPLRSLQTINYIAKFAYSNSRL